MTSRRGFTLIEMSMVVILIGLMVGGIIIGRDMILNAQLQTIITDVNRFKNAAKLFKEKYQYLPGDFPSAETIWGPEPGSTCPAGVTTTPWAPRVTTCNGNGDGRVHNAGDYSVPTSTGSFSYEPLRVWQHLANARFIEGQYSGVGYGVTAFYKPGVNIPPSKVSAASGFIFYYSFPIDAAQNDPTGSSIPEAYPSEYGHIIQYGGGRGLPITSIWATAAFNDSPALTPLQAQSIDKKIDDGMPSTGNVLTFYEHNSVTDCHDSATPPAYNTSTSSTDLLCALIFLTGL